MPKYLGSIEVIITYICIDVPGLESFADHATQYWSPRFGRLRNLLQFVEHVRLTETTFVEHVRLTETTFVEHVRLTETTFVEHVRLTETTFAATLVHL